MDNYIDPELQEEPEEEEQESDRRRSSRRRGHGCVGALLYVITVLGISVVLSLIAIFAANDVFAFIKSDTPITLNVENNTTISKLAKELDDANVIHYGSVFKIYLKLKGKEAGDTGVLAGSYLLNSTMDYGQIISALTNAANEETTQITIPEGYSVEQIKQLFLEQHICTEDAMNKALSNYPFKHDFLQDEKPVENGWLEGYLFPDTYEIYKGNSKVVDSLNKMLNNFDDKYNEEIQAGADAIGRSMHDIVTIASLVEREAKKDEERAKIAGVIYNRLNNPDAFPNLQVDASVLYGLGRTGGKLTETDLHKDTPYNLYTRQGLPPGPICNPGYKSLYAAAYPEEHGYYYYVAMPDGTHRFSDNYEEHQNNIAASNAAQAEAENATNTEENTDNAEDGYE